MTPRLPRRPFIIRFSYSKERPTILSTTKTFFSRNPSHLSPKAHSTFVTPRFEPMSQRTTVGGSPSPDHASHEVSPVTDTSSCTRPII